MSYSNLREQQEREMEGLLIERLNELEKFRKMKAENWAQPDKYDDDIERLQNYYTNRTQGLREQHENARKAYLNEPEGEPINEPEPKDQSNPVDRSSINDYFDKAELQDTAPPEDKIETTTTPKKKYRFRKK